MPPSAVKLAADERMPTCRVLIADDNRDAAESMAILLRQEGHEVWVAHDGETARRFCDQGLPNVALLDIGLPLVNGHELAREIRARTGGERVLLVAVTGWGQEKDRSLSRAAGFNHHLVKPVEPDQIVHLCARSREGATIADSQAT